MLMHCKQITLLLALAIVPCGCNRTGSTASVAPDKLPVEARGVDLTAYGIPGVIDLPERCQITQTAPENIAIDREDDAFDLRILPWTVFDGPVERHRKSLQGDPWVMIADEGDGYAAWYVEPRGGNQSPIHHIEIRREVMLGDRKFIAAAIITDDRGSRELAERIWRTAKSLRAK
jgi:hypothetical protein